MATQLIEQELLALIEDYHAYNPASAPVLPYPTALDFAKQVSRGLPCVYSIFNTEDEREVHRPRRPQKPYIPRSWPATSWTREDLINKVTEPVEVAVTPDGRADSLCNYGSGGESIFLQPASMTMSMEALLDKVCIEPADRVESEPVYYLQSQNGNLTNTPLQNLMIDLPHNFDFAEPVLSEPDAVNIWVGNERSVTSTHRDPYENLYLVLRGQKTFTLWPPVDEITLNAKLVRTGRYVLDDKGGKHAFSISLDGDDEIPWVPIDPHQSRAELNRNHHLYRHAHPQEVTVETGQMLYLPSGWYHHVSQKGGVWPNGSVAPCIAINYWYDQDYEGEKYVFRQHLSRLVERYYSGIP